MAAELVGGAFLSSLFDKLFDKLASTNAEDLNFFRGLKLDEWLLKKLKIMLCSASQVLDDAEMKQLANPNVREWLFELKEAICVAEELLDDINYETLRYEIETEYGSKFKKLKTTITRSRTSFDQVIEKILDKLDFIVKQKDVLGLKESVNNRLSQRLPAPLADESCVYGRNGDKEKIMKLLLPSNGSSSENKISVIPIVGMGGIGRTTLAQLVYEDISVKSQFDIRSWVTVSDESEISVIAKKILQEITHKQCLKEDLFQLQCELKKSLIGKRFFFVLDDVWNENYGQWEVLLSSFQSGAYGSMLIVTTRSDIIAKNMGNVPAHHLRIVSDDDCWKLFEEHVFSNAKSKANQELHAIGRDIVKKCKGVPLAIKSLAGLLRSVSDPEEWKAILKSEMWELQLQESQSNNILASLWLSYHYLPSHLKRCFAYCSIFPKDYAMNEFKKEQIILLWMAEGLLQPGKRGKRIEDVGNEYFQDLISRSLFHPLSKDNLNTLMHDLTHDLAVFVSGEFSCRLDDSDKAKFSRKTRHFSYSKNCDLESFEGVSAVKRLRTHLLLPSSYRRHSYTLSLDSQPKLLLRLGRCLRALCLSGSCFTVLPDSIGSLKCLRYLDLSYNSNIKEIPNTLCSLYNLQTLRLSSCTKLTELPTNMGNLVNLRHLYITDAPLMKMPPKMLNLKSLQTLSKFVVGKNGGSCIKELGGLHYLSGTLEISGLENVDVVGDVQEANLKDKEYINKLVYRWSSDSRFESDQSRKEIEVLDALQPHSNVKELFIYCYSGERFSNWIGHCSYTKMVTVHLHDCCCLLPSLGQLPSLQNLKVKDCHVERIGDEFYFNGGFSNVKPYFRSLKSLAFEIMPEWREWSFPEGQEDGGCFPNLEHLLISDCPKLNVCLPNFFPSLKTLEVIRGNSQIVVVPGIQQMETVFPSLDLLNIVCCPRLETFLLSNFPSNLKSLFISNDSYCRESRKKAPLSLIIKGCENVMKFPEALLPTTLTSLTIQGLKNLKTLNGEGFQHLFCLEELRIEYCEELQFFPGEMLSISLTSLHLRGLTKLEQLGNGLQHLIMLKELQIYLCDKLRCLSEIHNYSHNLLMPSSNLSSYACQGPSAFWPASIKKLIICHSENLQSLLEEGLPPSLSSLEIKGFPNLRNLSRMGFQNVDALKHLKISQCENLECLPELGLPWSLSSLDIDGCPLLEPRCQIGTGQDWHKISHIPRVYIAS